MVGNIPVLTYKPEDFPHWRPSIYQGFNSVEFSDRVRAVQTRWLEFNPAVGKIDNFHALSEGIADGRSAMVTSFKFSGGDKPDFFAMMRPSGTNSPLQQAANDFALDAHDVRSSIPKKDSDFIDTYHEIGHMDAQSKGLNLGAHGEEFYADQFALTKYLDSGGDPKVVRDYINSRSLAGFLQQPHKYWLAPALSSHFFGNTLDADWKQAFHANGELRLRVIDHLEFDGSLKAYSSAKLHEYLDLYDTGNWAKIDDSNIVNSMAIYRDHTPSDFNRDKSRLFAAVDSVANDPNVDIRTRNNAQMVLEGGRTFTPTLIPDHVKTRTAGIESKAAKGTGIAGVAVDLAEGNYVGAAVGSAIEAADTKIGKSAIEKVSRNFLSTAGMGVKFFGKRIPVIGAVVTAGFVAYETGAHALKGDFEKAGAAFSVGLAETAGNIVGFGIGDAAREGARQAFITVAGEEYAEIEKSGLRSIAESAFNIADNFWNDATEEKISVEPQVATVPPIKPTMG